MKTINATIGMLGLLASIMALSSLVYGAVQEPLDPYMQGIAGGMLDAYRTMRDLLFSCLGLIFSGLINWARESLKWLPPTPWLMWQAIYSDAAIIFSLVLSAGGNTAKDVKGIRSVYRGALQKPARGLSSGIFTVAKVSSGFAVLLIKHILIVAAGMLCFFLLAYSENRIGF